MNISFKTVPGLICPGQRIMQEARCVPIIEDFKVPKQLPPSVRNLIHPILDRGWWRALDRRPLAVQPEPHCRSFKAVRICHDLGGIFADRRGNPFKVPCRVCHRLRHTPISTLTEAKARETHDVLSAVLRFDATTRTIIDGRTVGFCKLIVDRTSGGILGCHVVGERAVEITQLAAIVIAARMRVNDLAHIPLSFPTYAGILARVAASATRELNLEVGCQPHQEGNTGHQF